jgi:plastocyanin
MWKKMVLLLSLMFLAFEGVWAYEGGPVSNGGEIKGHVKVAGERPKDPVVQVTKDPQHCGNTLPREKYVISADGGVQWTAVFIEAITKGKTASKEDLPIVNKMCQFHPHVQVGMSGQTVDVKNEDPMLHNTHMRFNNLTVFNSALPRQGMTIKRAINKIGLVDVQCDAHTFMHGFLYLADNPYITVTDAQGRFSIKDVPAGTYKLKFWHEAFGEQEKTVTVTAGGVAEANIEFGK